MRQFFKFTMASCLGIFLTVVIIFFGTIILSWVFSLDSSKYQVAKKSILEINLDSQIPEKTNNIEVDFTGFNTDPIIGLTDLAKTIKSAAEDDRIAGVLMNLSHSSTGFVTADVLRDAIDSLRRSGKPVLAYAEMYSEGDYYLASAADEVYVNTNGMFEFNGFAVSVPYYREMLDRLDVEMEVYYAGKFKGGSEPYRLTKMSSENRAQIKEFLGEIYANFLDKISASRAKSSQELKGLADRFAIGGPQEALDNGLVDGLLYWDQVKDRFKEKLELDEDTKLKTISLDKYYAKLKPKMEGNTKQRIAVIYAEGTIIDGEGEEGQVASADYMKLIEKVRNDDKIKAVVLRVNSPGGSALASDNILRELSLLQEAGKPLVVSMGDVAASGGYYIACQADRIYAEENTITGSIGVYSMMPILEGFMENKLGINYDSVMTGPNAMGINPMFNSSPGIENWFKQYTEVTYDKFLERVATGRDKTTEEVHAVAQGRVWTGERATQIGLVDEIGGLQAAIDHAAELADLESPRIASYPRTKEPMERLLEKYINPQSHVEHKIQAELGDLYDHYLLFKQVKEMQGNFMLMPYVFQYQ